MRRKAVVLLGTTLAIAAAGCEGQNDVPDSVAGAPEGPLNPDSELAPDEIRVEPEEVAPGSMVELHFPNGMPRGVAWVIERRHEDDWQQYYMVNTNAHSDELEPRSAPISQDFFGWPDIRIGGPGPDPVPIPDDAPAGEYRICHETRETSLCAALRATSDS